MRPEKHEQFKHDTNETWQFRGPCESEHISISKWYPTQGKVDCLVETYESHCLWKKLIKTILKYCVCIQIDLDFFNKTFNTFDVSDRVSRFFCIFLFLLSANTSKYSPIMSDNPIAQKKVLTYALNKITQ